jgi:hypothetical protein
MAKISVSLDEDIEEGSSAQKIKNLAAPLPSVSKAKSSALKDAPRVQFSFTNVPKPIKDEFASEARRRGISLKELLYQCLRAGGINIPDISKIDGRRR